jgi:adenylate cyclase class IV
VDTLASSVKRVWEQENFFFDGKQGELSSQRHVLRVRIYNGTEKAIITIKGQV